MTVMFFANAPDLDDYCPKCNRKFRFHLVNTEAMDRLEVFVGYECPPSTKHLGEYLVDLNNARCDRKVLCPHCSPIAYTYFAKHRKED